MAPPGTTISAPASASSSPSTPRGNKLSRKSGLSVALQNQNLVHPQPTQPSAKNNHARRNPEQTHLRHHSMPAQQRPASSSSSNSAKGDDSKKVTILKRSSATTLAGAAAAAAAVAPSQDALVGGAATAATTATSSPKQQHVQTKQHQQQQKNHFNNNNNHRQPKANHQQQQQQHPSSKARRVQRRKEIEAVQESLAKAELDATTMEHSPPLNNALASPPSSTDSDDSESGSSSSRSRTTTLLGHHSKGQRAVKNGQPSSSGGASRPSQLATSPPQRPSSAPVLPQGRKGMPTPAVTPHQTGYRGHTQNLSTLHQGHVQRKASFGSASALPLDQHTTPRPNVTKASSADKVVLADRIAAEKAKLYAGPTFHNSPAPTSLPIPAFSRSLSSSPMEPSVETLPTTFPEASSPHLNSSSRQRTQSDTYSFNTTTSSIMAATKPMSVPSYPLSLSHGGYPLGHQYPAYPPPLPPHHPPQPQPGYGYNVPDRMATSSFSPVAPNGDHLMEISQNLRTLLKIQSQ